MQLQYARRGWTATIAVSGMNATRFASANAPWDQDEMRLAFDGRAEVARHQRELAGLTDVTWRTGVESLNWRYDLDLAMPLLSRDGSPRPPLPAADPLDTTSTFQGTFWTHDLAAWTSIRARLAPAIRATLGVRADAFLRGEDLALSPRGSLDVRVAPRTFLQLAAGAYRRPPEAGEELLHPTLNPERATQLVARVAHDTDTGLHVASSLYFTDRRRLVMRDAYDRLVNTGRGIDHGIEVVASQRWKRWFLYVGASLSKSVRHDFARAATRPSEYDQPVRVDALAQYAHGRWKLGARVQLSSGLPDTPVLGAVYDADRDHYDPLYGTVYGARMPFQHQLDLRIDRRFRSFAAFLEVSNAYASDRALGYEYSYDYSERAAVTQPILPFFGIRGPL
jgi:hypothetical protein